MEIAMLKSKTKSLADLKREATQKVIDSKRVADSAKVTKDTLVDINGAVDRGEYEVEYQPKQGSMLFTASERTGYFRLREDGFRVTLTPSDKGVYHETPETMTISWHT
jgi:hypothetical protein